MKEAVLKKERRAFFRFDIDAPLAYTAPALQKEREARLVNISASGIGMSTNDFLPVGATVDIWLSIPGSKESVCTRGRVVWAKEETPRNFREGIMLYRADLLGVLRILTTCRKRGIIIERNKGVLRCSVWDFLTKLHHRTPQ